MNKHWLNMQIRDVEGGILKILHRLSFFFSTLISKKVVLFVCPEGLILKVTIHALFGILTNCQNMNFMNLWCFHSHSDKCYLS